MSRAVTIEKLRTGWLSLRVGTLMRSMAHALPVEYLIVCVVAAVYYLLVSNTCFYR